MARLPPPATASTIRVGESWICSTSCSAEGDFIPPSSVAAAGRLEKMGEIPISRHGERTTLQVSVFLVLVLEALDMIKKVLIVGGGAALLGLVFVGRDAMSYLRTSAGYVSDAVQEAVPIEFQVDRAGYDPRPLARGPKEHARDRQGGGRSAAARRADRRHPHVWPRRRGSSCG